MRKKDIINSITEWINNNLYHGEKISCNICVTRQTSLDVERKEILDFKVDCIDK